MAELARLVQTGQCLYRSSYRSMTGMKIANHTRNNSGHAYRTVTGMESPSPIFFSDHRLLSASPEILNRCLKSSPEISSHHRISLLLSASIKSMPPSCLSLICRDNGSTPPSPSPQINTARDSASSPGISARAGAVVFSVSCRKIQAIAGEPREAPESASARSGSRNPFQDPTRNRIRVPDP